jgi:hypothetical protein
MGFHYRPGKVLRHPKTDLVSPRPTFPLTSGPGTTTQQLPSRRCRRRSRPSRHHQGRSGRQIRQSRSSGRRVFNLQKLKSRWGCAATLQLAFLGPGLKSRGGGRKAGARQRGSPWGASGSIQRAKREREREREEREKRERELKRGSEKRETRERGRERGRSRWIAARWWRRVAGRHAGGLILRHCARASSSKGRGPTNRLI